MAQILIPITTNNLENEMDLNTRNVIEILNGLIQLNNDRMVEYQFALSDTNESDLKLLFNEFSITSKRLNDDLIAEVENIRGIPIEGISTSGRMFEVWMDVKSAIARKDRTAILNSCEYAEEWIVKAYEDIMHNQSGVLTKNQNEMIRDQFTIIKSDHDTIKQLRNHVRVQL